MFSIVIPLFNKAHTIERALKSVFSQTFKKFEIIVVDDGSTDNGIEIINKFENFDQIKIVKQENQGASVARNNGVKKAKYEFIAFLDGDDEWESKYLETMYGAIKLHPNCGMVCCGRYYKDDITKKITPLLAKKYEGMIRKINFFENPLVFTHTSSTIIKKNIFDKVGGFQERMINNEDLLLFFLIALIEPTVYCGFPLSYYYGNVKGQLTTKNKLNFYEANLDICKRFNLTYKMWDSRGRENKIFKIFLKYEFRHLIINSLRKNDFNTIKLFLENIDKDILKLFPFFEMKFYGSSSLKNWNKFYILITKLLWRTRGYPIARK